MLAKKKNSKKKKTGKKGFGAKRAPLAQSQLSSDASKASKFTASTSSSGAGTMASSLAARVAAKAGAANLNQQHNIGMDLMAEKKYDEAGLAFEAVINVDPDAVDSWSALGVCMTELGQPDAALMCQKQVLRIRSGRTESQYAEDQFEQVSAPTSALPPLPDGRQLVLTTGSLEACETGGRIWSSAIVLCRWLRRHSTLMDGSTVLELGCGTGAVGLYAAALGASRVVLTDGGPAALLSLARANAANPSNQELWSGVQVARGGGDGSAAAADDESASAVMSRTAATIEVSAHSWGEPAASLGEGFDWVLGSDVTYSAGAQLPLCRSLAAQLRLHSRGCRVVLAHERRVPEVPGDDEGGEAEDAKLSSFLEAARSEGLAVSTIHTEEVDDGRLISLLEITEIEITEALGGASAGLESLPTSESSSAGESPVPETSLLPVSEPSEETNEASEEAKARAVAAEATLADPIALRRLSRLLDGCLALQSAELWQTLRQVGRQASPPMRFDDISLNVRSGPSALHGLGAFANAPLPAGTVATLYPVHSIGIGSQRVASAEDAEYWKEPCTSAYRSQAFHASTPGFPTAGPLQGWAPGVYVDANPTRPHVPGWMAHLANDCAVVGADATEAEILAYYATCEQKANCAMLPFGAAAPVMALVTTRDVEDGEELLTAYGHSYWVAHFGGTPPPSTPAVTRAAASMWTDGLDAKVAKLEAAYADEVKVLVGLLAKGPPS